MEEKTICSAVQKAYDCAKPEAKPAESDLSKIAKLFNPANYKGPQRKDVKYAAGWVVGGSGNSDDDGPSFSD